MIATENTATAGSRTSTERVLLVDDDPNVLKAYERRLRRSFDVETALCSEEGLTAVNILGPFAVVVSDMAMPRENGAEFLERLLTVSPDSIRIMLTGNADQGTAVQAVNQARVFRFLNKPCEADELELAIGEGIAEYRARSAERALMAQTVNGVVAMLTRVLSLANPTAFGKATRLQGLAKEFASASGLDDSWELEIAASLSQLGAVTITESWLSRVAEDNDVEGEPQSVPDGQYELAAELIGEAPRLETIARIVALQSTNFVEECTDSPRTLESARALRALLAFDELTHAGELPWSDALRRLTSAPEPHDAKVLDALKQIATKRDARRLAEVGIDELDDQMQLVSDVTTAEGTVLVAKGHNVTLQLIQRLKNYASKHELNLPIRVLVSEEVVDGI